MAEPLRSRRAEPGLPPAYNGVVSRRPGTRLMEQGERHRGGRNAAGEDLPAEPVAPAGRTEDDAADRRAEDHALIRRAQAGDEDAFASLVEQHRARAWRVARGLVGSDEDAQDLVQEAF